MADTDNQELQPILGDVLSRALKRLLGTGRERLELRQLNRDLDHFWVRLGKTAFRLSEAGEIDHPAIRKAMDRIGELEAQIDELRQSR